MRRLLARLSREERGSILPLVALTMALMIGLAAFAIDVAGWYQTQRKAQATADAAALAAAQDLPYDPATATDYGQAYVSGNLSGATGTITTPYNGNSAQVKATVSVNAPSFFAGIFGLGPVTVSATAVAQANASTVPTAIFAKDTTCGGTGVTVSGNNLNITGTTRSNGSFTFSGNNDTFGITTYGGPSHCSDSLSGGATFNGASTPTLDAGNYGWPADYSQSPPPCTYTATNFSWSTTGQTLPAGVYCATGTISISGNQVSGNVTLIASSFSISANGLQITPYYRKLILYQTGSSTLTIIGNNMAGGTVFAPNADVIINGNNGNGQGFVEGQHVTLSGNNWGISGDGTPIYAGSSLIQ